MFIEITKSKLITRGKRNGQIIPITIKVSCDNCNKEWERPYHIDTKDYCQSCKNILGLCGMKGHKHSLETRKKWSEERSGDNNVSKRKDVKEKLSKSLKGRDTYWLKGKKRPEHSIKMHDFMINVWNNNNDFRNDYRQKLINKLNSTHSKLHDYFKHQMIINNITDFISEYKIPGTKIIVDEINLEKNIIIEINGDYWHANSLYYKSDDKIKYPGKTLIANDVWNNNKRREYVLESLGYNVVYIWESDMKNINECIKKIKETYETY
jgi:G:T-mismatch repair DNA endonuclease (very short patch repair protein)